MSIAEVHEAVEKMSLVERKKLMGHLMAMEIRENEAYRDELTRRANDKNSDNWVSLEQVKKQLGVK